MASALAALIDTSDRRQVAALAAGGAAALAGLVALVGPKVGKPAATKPFASFSEFYPHYLKEHSKQGTKRMHLLGTGILAVLLARQPELLLALGAGGSVGLAVFPFLRSLKGGLIEMALMMGTYLAVGTHATGSWQRTLALPAAAYACAWVGHFVIEKNRPATFIYPTFSLMGDFRMAAEMLLGRIPI